LINYYLKFQFILHLKRKVQDLEYHVTYKTQTQYRLQFENIISQKEMPTYISKVITNQSSKHPIQRLLGSFSR